MIISNHDVYVHILYCNLTLQSNVSFFIVIVTCPNTTAVYLVSFLIIVPFHFNIIDFRVGLVQEVQAVRVNQ